MKQNVIAVDLGATSGRIMLDRIASDAIENIAQARAIIEQSFPSETFSPETDFPFDTDALLHRFNTIKTEVN